jgi:hypothetical protein
MDALLSTDCGTTAKTTQSAVVKHLGERGLVSAYDDHFGEPQGEESRRTMFFYRREHRPFHIDYIFISRAWAAQLTTRNKNHLPVDSWDCAGRRA